MKKIIDTPEIGDNRFKQWTKTLNRVDVTKTNGYAFEGNFIRSRQELEVGSYILAYGQVGSRANNYPRVELFRVAENGLESVYKKADLSQHWALDVRDDIAKIVNQAEKINPLEKYTTEELLAELKNRGIKLIFEN